jgi:hypothetical protein
MAEMLRPFVCSTPRISRYSSFSVHFSFFFTCHYDSRNKCSRCHDDHGSGCLVGGYRRFHLQGEESASLCRPVARTLKMEHHVTPTYHYTPTKLLTHGSEPFLRSRQLCDHSRTSHHFMEREGSIPCSQALFTGPYPEPY